MATKTSQRTKTTGSKRLELVKSKIHPADNFDVLKMLVYGQNGKGKTRFGASGPRDVLLVDCNERGSLSIRKFPGVEVFKAEVWTDIDLAFWHLHSGNHNYQTVVLDTVTAAAQLCMRFVLGDESSRDPTKDPDMPGKREWGKVGELMKTLILNFRNLDMHVIFLAQERRGFTEDEDEAPEIFPDVSPSVRTTLTASVDIIGHVFTKEVVKKGEKGKGETVASYRMLIGPSERYITKDRSESGLPPLIALGDNDDNLEKLVERIKKGA